MKYIFLILFSMNCILTNAQQTENYWFTNQVEAIAYASENNTDILMVFAGSDWCRPCIKFKKDILEATNFKEYADGNFIVLYLDFPSKKKNRLSEKATMHNETLAEQYNQSGSFPKIVLLDKDMKKIKELDYEGQNSDQFITMIK